MEVAHWLATAGAAGVGGKSMLGEQEGRGSSLCACDEVFGERHAAPEASGARRCQLGSREPLGASAAGRVLRWGGRQGEGAREPTERAVRTGETSREKALAVTSPRASRHRGAPHGG